MKRLNLYETDQRTINGTIQQIQQSFDTTNAGAATVTGPKGGDLTVSGGSAIISGTTGITAFSTNDPQLQFILDADGTPLTALTLGTTDPISSNYAHVFDFAGNDASSLVLKTSNAGQYGPYVLSYANSASPAVGDQIGGLLIYGKNNTPAAFCYGKLYWEIRDATAASEDSRIKFNHLANGVMLDSVVFDSGNGTTFDLGSANYPTFTVKGTSAADGGPEVHLFQDSASPAAFDAVGAIVFIGRDSATNSQTYGYIQNTIVDATSASEDAYINIATVVAGAAGDRVRIGGGLYHASATGTDKGNNTINFGAVYDDNVLLTCYALEVAQSGVMDLDYWDGFTPASEHPGAARFAARLGTEYDPTTLSGQRKHVADKKHLTPYLNPAKYDHARRPSLGGWVSRHQEMDSLLFLYVCELEDRINSLESARAN